MAQADAHHKKSHQQHQNCENCLRQKKQNQTWIKIYQRLQEVQKNTQRISNAVKEHKLCSDANRSFYKSYEQKTVSLPKVKCEVNTVTLQNLGFEVAIGILQKQSKSKLVEQNNRLKKELIQMRNQLCKEPRQRNSQSINSSYFSEKKQEEDRNLDETTASLNFKRSNIRLCESQVYQKIQKGHTEETEQNNSTQYSSFNVGRARNTFASSRYNDLSLWLYENDKHSKLQEDLFAPQKGSKNAFLGKRNAGMLPSIRVRK